MTNHKNKTIVRNGVYNCYTVNCTTSGCDEVGGIAGSNEGSISNCISNNGTITNSGSTKNRAGFGGITGYNNGSISNSGNSSTVSPSGSNTKLIYTGGIAGLIQHKSQIQNCYNTGSISTLNSSGGIVGFDLSKTTAVVANSYTSIESCPLNFGTFNGVEKNVKALPAADMKTTTFLEQLNTNRGDNASWLKWEFRSESEYPVLEKVSFLSNCQITLNQTTYEYTGTEIIPSIKISDKDIELQKDTNYTISYKNNINLGTATITITGLGKYSGTVEKTITITAKKLSNENITLAEENFVYNGRVQEPSVSVKIGNKELNYETDYILSYENNQNAGTAFVHIQGTGNYTGTIDKAFLIKKATPKIYYVKKYKKSYSSRPFYVYVNQVKGDDKLTYNSSNKKVATVNKRGKVVIRKIGKTIITATAASTNNYKKKSVKITVRISRR